MGFHSSFLKPIPEFWSRRIGTIVPFTIVVDYRGLNLELLGNSMGVPRIDDLLDHWVNASSTTDLASTFWSIPMRESDKKYTAFHAYCDGGFQQYQVQTWYQTWYQTGGGFWHQTWFLYIPHSIPESHARFGLL